MLPFELVEMHLETFLAFLLPMLRHVIQPDVDVSESRAERVLGVAPSCSDSGKVVGGT